MGACGCVELRQVTTLVNKSRALPDQVETVAVPIAAAHLSRPSQSDKPKMRLLEKYALGKKLGEGAFGVVYKCKDRQTGEDWAVKMVDQAESPEDVIKREIDVLRKLVHPSIIYMHEVLHEKCFVCIVLRIHMGGDMIQGMMRHWKSKGMIPCEAVRRLSRQIWEPIAFMHTKSFVHRDVKGDNYLMDMPDVEHPQNRIYLNDMGTARAFAPGERMKNKCGTDKYWPPEAFRGNYGHKVDCWALGVLMYGLFCGKFPFQSERETMTKMLKPPKEAPDDARELMFKALERDEAKRIEAWDSLKHAFIADLSTKIGAGPADGADEAAPQMRNFGANGAVQERRRELLDRLQAANDDGGDSDARSRMRVEHGDAFVVQDHHNDRSIKYRWTPDSEARPIYAMFDTAPLVTSAQANKEVRDEQIDKLLADYGISTEKFGKGQARTFAEFVEEIQTGQSRLLLDATQHKSLVRVVEVVLLKISIETTAGRMYLIETKEKYPDGRTREVQQLPGNKQVPHESTLQTAERLCREMLNMGDCKILFDSSRIESFEEDVDSPSFPGVRTVYQKEIISGTVKTTNSAILQRIGIGSGVREFAIQDLQKYTRNYAWMTSDMCESKGVRLRAKTQRGDISALVPPPIGWNHEELVDLLEQNNIDVSKWGQDTYRTLEDLSEELLKGESTLVKYPDGKMRRVVDIVVLKIVDSKGRVLVEAEESTKTSTKTRNRLPAIKRRSDEHQFIAARRLITRLLQLSDNAVVIDHMNVRCAEETQESVSYLGLNSLYRKRFMTAKHLGEV